MSERLLYLISEVYMPGNIKEIITLVSSILAMAFCIVAFLLKNRKTILVAQLIGMAMWSVHFFLMGEYAGAAMNGLAVARSLVYVQRDRHKWANSKFVPAAFVFIFIAAGVTTRFIGNIVPGMNNDYMWWLPTIAMTITSIGLFFKNEQTMRALNTFSSPPWIVYNVLAKSPLAVITESLSLLSVLLGLIIYGRKKKASAEAEKESE